ncbi:MAG: hypothetical protein Q7U14_02905, partial [Lacisediminimonas sp.]|nr:hypothetical protein [Lacisediminimonas sp.]
LDKALKKRVINEGLNPYLKDNVDAWELDAEGDYHRKKPRARQSRFGAQASLMQSLGNDTTNGVL